MNFEKDLDLTEQFQYLLRDLQENRLIVEKVQGTWEGYVRRVSGENSEWYKELCSLYPVTHKYGRKVRARRNPRTIIKRQNIERVLRTLIKYGESTSKYSDYLIKVARDQQNELSILEQNYKESVDLIEIEPF